MKETVYDKYLRFKDLFREKFPEITELVLFRKLGKLESWHYPKKRWADMTLSKEEAKIYEWMLTNKYNPSTVYKWFRILGDNKKVQEQVKNRVISFREAKTYDRPFRRLTELEAELMYHIKQTVERYIVR